MKSCACWHTECLLFCIYLMKANANHRRAPPIKKVTLSELHHIENILVAASDRHSSSPPLVRRTNDGGGSYQLSSINVSNLTADTNQGRLMCYVALCGRFLHGSKGWLAGRNLHSVTPLFSRGLCLSSMFIRGLMSPNPQEAEESPTNSYLIISKSKLHFSC